MGKKKKFKLEAWHIIAIIVFGFVALKGGKFFGATYVPSTTPMLVNNIFGITPHFTTNPNEGYRNYWYVYTYGVQQYGSDLYMGSIRFNSSSLNWKYTNGVGYKNSLVLYVVLKSHYNARSTFNVSKHDYITVEYNDRTYGQHKTIDIFFPKLTINPREEVKLYVAEDGSTYYDSGLTNLAEPAVACLEDWQCTDWSGCIAGIQSRSCTDVNVCGTTENKPSESKSCIVPDTTPPTQTTPPLEEEPEETPPETTPPLEEEPPETTPPQTTPPQTTPPPEEPRAEETQQPSTTTATETDSFLFKNMNLILIIGLVMVGIFMMSMLKPK